MHTHPHDLAPDAGDTRRRVRLPRVIATSVIRSAYQGESHGGVYLLDLERDEHDLVIDWDDAGIDWSGRGGDRGLRGVAFHGDRLLLAASDEVFVYSRDFERLGSIRNRYLRHCHEIDVHGDHLYLTSCGYDSILRYSLADERFDAGWCVRPLPVRRWAHRALGRLSRGSADDRLLPPAHLRRFDPESPDGPGPADTVHVNSVRVRDDGVFVGARRFDRLYVIAGDTLRPYGRIPLATHNAQPFRDGILLNDTGGDAVRFTGRDGTVRASFPVPAYPETALRNVSLATGGRARQAFGRGLTVWNGDHLVAGSSPATIAVHALDAGSTVHRVNLTMDVRNAIHGLEVWPDGGA